MGVVGAHVGFNGNRSNRSWVFFVPSRPRARPEDVGFARRETRRASFAALFFGRTTSKSGRCARVLVAVGLFSSPHLRELVGSWCQGTWVGCLFRKKKKKVVAPKFDKKYCFFLNVYKKTEFHALLHRGQALNAYEAKMHLDNGTLDFGHGLDFESGKTKKAEKRPPTQIEIMASMEREKQAKKEERRLAREAKKQARLEQEEFIRNGGNIKLSKKEKRRLEAEMEN